jgi:hypothetical protein
LFGDEIQEVEARSHLRDGGQIRDEVAGIEDPVLQLRTALSDIFPGEKNLLTVVGRTFPDREPQDVLDDWVDTVSKLS